MESKWLEDFISLAQTRSFSRAAQLRHVTQPAFSRRIQALEAWAGADLVDRSSYPTQLTAAGKTMYDQALEMLQALQTTRAMLRVHASAQAGMVGFAVPHTLALTFFPRWVSDIQREFGTFKSRLMALNVHDAALRLTEGGCDLLIAYHHDSDPLPLDPAKYDMVLLGQELLAPYSRADENGRPQYQLSANNQEALPFLSYGPGAYLGRLTALILKNAKTLTNLDRVYETDMAEGLKVMALAGHGIAFLPYSAVRDELKNGRLVKATETTDFDMPMDIRAYRDRNATGGILDELWKFLQTQTTSP